LNISCGKIYATTVDGVFQAIVECGDDAEAELAAILPHLTPGVLMTGVMPAPQMPARMMMPPPGLEVPRG
jgi:hypothetical protein